MTWPANLGPIEDMPGSGSDGPVVAKSDRSSNGLNDINASHVATRWEPSTTSKKANSVIVTSVHDAGEHALELGARG